MLVAPEKIRFGRWQLDLQRRILCADDTPVPLNGRGFDLLALLIARHGQAVTRDEIFASVWPGITVGENNLTVQISNLRKILRANPDDPELIVTVPGRGYRFAGELEPPPAPPRPAEEKVQAADEIVGNDPEPERHTVVPRRVALQHLLAPAATAILLITLGATQLWPTQPTAPRLSIAVLPFRSLGSDTGQADLADALTDDLTTDLAHIPASTVIARESADVWRGKSATVQQIARALRVRYLVEGSIMREETQYHVNTQLIDADTGGHLWAARFETPPGRLGEVRDAIVRKLATALDFQITQLESARSLRDRPDDPDAIDLFFRARAMLDASDVRDTFTQAQRLLERAVAKRPDFADAWAVLGAMILSKTHDTNDPDQPSDQIEARDAIARALKLSPNNATAMAAESHRLAIGGDCTAAIYSANATLAIEPSSLGAESVLADCSRRQGHLEEAIVHLEALLRLSPEGPKTRHRYLTLGYIYMLKDDVGQAIKYLRQANAGLAAPTSSESMGRQEFGRLLLIAAMQRLGDTATAHSFMSEYNRIWPNRTVWRIGAMFSNGDTAYKGTGELLTALQQAGMRFAADERMPGQRVITPCPGGEFDDTPLQTSGVTTLDTQAVIAELKKTPRPTLVDLADGTASPPEATWYNYTTETEKPNEFVLRSASSHRPFEYDEEIIVMGNGTYGCTSLDAVRSLALSGYTNVKWYRGGEEAWAISKQPFVNRRPS